MDSTLYEELEPAERSKLTNLIRAEFTRTSNLKSEKDRGKSLFDYGEPDGFVYSTEVNTETVNEKHHSVCMAQQFSGGSSLCSGFRDLPDNWCIIIVTKESLKKNEAYTLRDTMAAHYYSGQGAGVIWGLPTSNQYWVVEDGKEVLYQQFENGYARAVDGGSLSDYFSFYYKWDEEMGMNFPKSGYAERPSYMLPDGTKGDVDGNNAINVSDIMTLKGLIMDGSWTDEQLAAGDMNDDKTLNVSDILSIKTLIMNGI